MENEWGAKFPDKEGCYWFYGYRYGNFFGDRKNKKELCFCKNVKISNGTMLIADGQVMYRSEIQEGLFQKVQLPELPIEGDIIWKN